MNQFLSNKIIAGIVAVALLVGVGVLISSGDTSSTTRNAALVVATPCTKPGQVTKVSKQSVVCATTNTGSLWYATMKAKGKAQACKSPGVIRKKSKIVWVCGVVKKKKLWQATQPLPPAVVASTTVIEPGATQPTPALDSTQVATPDVPINADNAVLADPKIPDDKIVTQVIEDVTTPTVAPTSTTSTTSTTIPLTCATGGTCVIGDTGPGGGKVFYDAGATKPWGRYLEAAPTDYKEEITDERATAQWGCFAVLVPGTSLEIGTGRANTKIITDKLCIGTDTRPIAASIAKTYNGGGKTDWFLPSRDELNELCKYARTQTTGTSSVICNNSGSLRDGFADSAYWSSSGYSEYSAWHQYFNTGPRYANFKSLTLYVRPVRAF